MPGNSQIMKPLLAVCAFLLLPAEGRAQAIPRVDVGWGVDTLEAAWTEASWHAAAVDIFRSWRAYLMADAHLQVPTKYWSIAEQQKWPAYDLTAGVAYKGMPATVLDIRPVADSVFVVKTLFSSVSAQERVARPVALTRVYAVREGGMWVFSNALVRNTQQWPHHTVGSFTFVIDPTLRFDRARAVSTVAFADSVAESLGAAAPSGVTYIVAQSPEALHDVLGVEWTFGGQGHGYAIPWNNLILSGDSAFREGNRHEVVHHVVATLPKDVRPHPLVNEGIATWLGGTVGRAFADLRREYAAYVRDRPDITLDRVLQRGSPDEGLYPAGAILLEMVYRRAGWSGVNTLLRSGRSDDELRTALTRILGLSWSDVEAAWRRRVLNNASAS